MNKYSRKLSDWSRKKLLSWLGISGRITQLNARIEEMESLLGEYQAIAIDHHIMEGANSIVITVSYLNSGFVKITPVNFKDTKELFEFVKFTQERYKMNEKSWFVDSDKAVQGTIRRDILW